MLARKRQSNGFALFYRGFPDCEVEFVANKTGIVKKTGREPTMEQFAAHPALQDCDPEFLLTWPRRFRLRLATIRELKAIRAFLQN
jgi:hypothetical protein